MESGKLLKAIIETAIDGIITIDNKGLVESLNPAAQSLFGYSLDEVIGRNISMLMPEPDRTGHDGYLKRYQHTGEKRIIGKGREVMGLRKDGTTFPFRLAVSEVKYDERIIYTGFIHDLSKEKEAERRLIEYAAELEGLVEERTRSLKKTVSALSEAKEEVSLSLLKEKELNQMKSRFVSMASHEFRTPLSSVQLSSVLIEKYAAPFENDNIKKHVNKIKSAVNNLTTILNDFLSLERLEAGNVQSTLEPFDLVKLAEEVTEEMQMIAKQEQNIIYQHTGVESLVNLDQNLLRNCMINLISNAIKYSGDGTFIEFNTEIKDSLYTVTVSDNGIGIPDLDQKNLFQPFFRANNTGNIPGTGLGLNIVLRYVRLMNGSVEFKSEVNKGAKFILSFNKQ
ncbi:PAS domain S-box protein [Pedobacter sp. JCM 36344]|uniref:PAS domain-containing sensor histidine kinase n=1 Tax=Pedobacter sp. JCM 36344 TaxID=3374280 RepID=UPI00397E61C5